MKPQIQGHHSSLPSAELSLSFPWTVLPPEGPLWFPLCLAGCLAYADVQYFFVFVFDIMNKRVMVSPLLLVEVQSVSTLRSAPWPVGDLDIVLWPSLPSASWFPVTEPQSLFLLQDPEPVAGGHLKRPLSWDLAVSSKTIFQLALWRWCCISEKFSFKTDPL